MLRKALALYTGGKDSHYAIIEALKLGVQVTKLVIVEAKKEDSWMFHTINIRWAEKHAELMGLDYLKIRVSGVKEKEVDELKSKLSEIINDLHEYDYLVTGAVASKYQKERVDSLAELLGLKHLAPLWGRDQYELMREESAELGFIMVAVQAYGMGAKWLGRIITVEAVDELRSLSSRYGISPVGEGGEFETFVFRSPLFKGRWIYINKSAIIYDPIHWTGYYIIEKAQVLP